MRVKLKDVCDVLNGRAYSDDELLECGKTKILRVGNFFNNSKYFYSDLQLEDNKYCEYNDLLYCWSASFGAFLCKEKQKCIYHYHIWKLTNFRDINKFYLYYSLIFITEQLKKSTHGSIMMHLTKENFENIEIDLPDRKAQDKIVEILSGIDAQIERNNELVKSLQVLGNTIYSQNAKSQTETFNIENVCKPIWGNCPAGDNILNQCLESAIPYASGAGDIDDNTSVNPKAFTNKPTRIVHKNDICISVAGTVGKIAVATEDICIGRAMLGFTNSELYGYIYFGLSSYASALQKKAIGAIQKIINSEHLAIVNLPTYTSKVVKSLNSVIDEILRIENYTKQLVQLKEKLLPLLINGQLHV